LIFVTVGSQLPFDRLIRGMDAWAEQNKNEQVFAQVGFGDYRPKNISFEQTLMPEEFRKKCNAADLIVSHAGIGNVLLALELQKPVILVPRRFSLGEHRNDHQMATVKWLEGKPGIFVVYECDDLGRIIKSAKEASVNHAFSPYASPELIGALKDFINQP
jgi:UDP-N-acetylglucosamine transferase subunit ALG13